MQTYEEVEAWRGRINVNGRGVWQGVVKGVRGVGSVGGVQGKGCGCGMWGRGGRSVGMV